MQEGGPHHPQQGPAMASGRLRYWPLLWASAELSRAQGSSGSWGQVSCLPQHPSDEGVPPGGPVSRALSSLCY